jgi:mannose-6-phosphate isomerase-like protein (cupin superfamily)
MSITINNSQPCDPLKLIDLQHSQHITWGKDCDVYTLLNTNKFHIIHEAISPGNKDKMHYHSVSDQFLYLLSGKITVKLINDTITLKQYQGVMIPAKCAHYVENEDGETAILLTISVPGQSDDRVLV